MAKIIDLGLKKADDPIFSEGLRITSVRRSKGSMPIGEGLQNLVGEQKPSPLEGKEQELNKALKSEAFKKQGRQK